jgi:undecaprenyl pyrophosphate phosphatase UppP
MDAYTFGFFLAVIGLSLQAMVQLIKTHAILETLGWFVIVVAVIVFVLAAIFLVLAAIDFVHRPGG